MLCRLPALSALTLIALTGCARPPVPPVVDLSGRQDVSRFALTSLKGTRDGDRLDVQVSYGDGSRELRADLKFKVTPPTRLESGTWSGLAGQGSVQQRSVIFLGGQSGPPSVGGRFDFVGPDQRALYRVNIPLQPLKHPL